MEYYIFRNDNLGSKIADILKEKAQEGVKVRVIVDGAGGYSKKMLKKLNKYGVETGVFFPSHFPFFKIANLRANYRIKKIISISKNLTYIKRSQSIFRGNFYI